MAASARRRYSFVSIFCIGVIAAVGTLVAIRQGAGDIVGAARLTQAGLWLAWLMALVAGLLLWNLKPVLLMFGQTETNVQAAGQFLIDPAVRPARLPELHGPARLHQRDWPRDAGDGHQPRRHRGQLPAQLRADHRHVRPAENGS